METISAFSLPPGFGFHPTDAELISHYLKRKILGLKIDYEVIPEVDIYKYEPWDLPAKCHIPTRDSKWHFFNSPDRKYPNGSRTNRATEAGYWKSTGKDRNIKLHNQVIGTKKTLVFHEGRPPCGKRTDWIMHEYYANENECKSAPGMKDIFVLCRVTKRNGLEFDSEHAVLRIEEIGTCPKLPKDASVPVSQEESPSPPQEDFEAWVKELYDPNLYAIHTIGELKTEPKILQGDFSSLDLKQEPIDFVAEFSESLDLLQSGDDFYSSLQSDILDPNSSVLENLYLSNTDFASSTQINTGWTINNEYTDNLESSLIDRNDNKSAAFDTTAFTQPNNNLDAGIQIRARAARAVDHPTIRLRLQVNKMELKNRQAMNQTIKITNHDLRLDLNNDLQYSASEVGEKHNPLESTDSADNQFNPSCRITSKISQRGIMRGHFVSLRCSSVALNHLFLGACMVGTAAVILYFLLGDARNLLSSFSALRL